MPVYYSFATTQNSNGLWRTSEIGGKERQPGELSHKNLEQQSSRSQEMQLSVSYPLVSAWCLCQCGIQ